MSKQESQRAQQEIEAQNADNYQNLIKDLNSIFPKLIRSKNAYQLWFDCISFVTNIFIVELSDRLVVENTVNRLFGSFVEIEQFLIALKTKLECLRFIASTISQTVRFNKARNVAFDMLLGIMNEQMANHIRDSVPPNLTLEAICQDICQELFWSKYHVWKYLSNYWSLC